MYRSTPSSGDGITVTLNCTDNAPECLPLCPGGNCVDYAAPPPPTPLPRAAIAVDRALPVRLLLTVSLLSAFLFLSLATLLLYRRRRVLRRRRRSATAAPPHGEGFGDDDGDEEAGGGGGVVHHNAEGLKLSTADLLHVQSSHSEYGVLITILIGLFWIIKRMLLSTEKPLNFNSTLTVFSESHINKATKSFSEKLGEGGFGCVFKGALPGFSAVAVKKLKGVAQGEKQFRAEVQTIGIIRHVNLVRLFGFCAEGRTRLLIYEYMENGSLNSHLFSKSSTKFTWDLRYHIALGTARGLAYLHEECKECIIHCDMKPDNVLLDAEFCPKIADFGMAKILGRDFSGALTTMRGTIGYLAPEWISGLPITHKADVYSYGMMLLEIISGRRNAEKIREGKYTYFPIFAAIKVNEGDVMCLLDRRLEGEADTEQLNRACRIACWCIQDAEDHRPMMGQVVHMLEGVMEVEIPPIPRSLQNYVGMEDCSYSADADSSL